MLRPDPRQLYTTDLDRHLYTLERDRTDGAARPAGALADRLRDAWDAGRESWRKIAVIANLF